MNKEADPREESIFNPGKADWLTKEGGRALNREQQALLLAITQLEAESGRKLSAEETAAIEALATQLEGFDADEILAAVRKMVDAPADPERRTAWPELKERLKKS